MRSPILILLFLGLLTAKYSNANNLSGNELLRDSIKVIYKYHYESVYHEYLTRIDVLDKIDGPVVKSTIYTYTGDYPSGSGFVDSLKAGRLLTYPIEVVNTEMGGVTFAKISKFYPNRKGLKESELLLEMDGSIGLADFRFSNRIINGIHPWTYEGIFNPNTLYKSRLKYNLYDNRGNLQQSEIVGGTYSSIIWGYNDRYPIAQVSNAAFSDVAYTSFESDSKGSWIFSGTPVVDNTVPTGSQCYLLSSGSLSKAGLNSNKEFQLSYWKKTGAVVNISGGTISKTLTGRTVDGWTYIVQFLSVNGTLVVGGTGYIDELRIHPKEAQMTTSGYLPAVGITFKADTRGNIIYYEYDGMQSLKYEKDQNKNIIKSYDYNYKL